MTDERELHDDYEPDYVAAWEQWTARQRWEQVSAPAQITHAQAGYPTSQVTGNWTQADWDNWYDKVFTTMKRDDPLRPKP